MTDPDPLVADVVEVHQTGWEPVLFRLPHYAMTWRLGAAMPIRDEALARAEQEAGVRNARP